MKQNLYSNEWISSENQSTKINLNADREEVFLIVSLKTVFENYNLVKSYDKTYPNVFEFGLWEILVGLNFFLSVYLWDFRQMSKGDACW